MTIRPRCIVQLLALAPTIAILACAPAGPAQPGGGSPAGQAAAPAPKVLTIGLQREIASFAEFESGGGGGWR